jgi:protein-L-isoaspartate(D-aspartate) O-methyltransferase
MRDLAKLREYMIKHHLEARGIDNPDLLKAMREVPREMFVPEALMEFAYEDSPLPIGEEQTISQPYIVAAMTNLLGLSANDRVLEIGAGSGYAAAILSRIVKKVYTIERHGSLIEAARERFSRLGYDNIELIQGDGTLGLPEQGPFDAIVVTAGAPDIPEPLKQQLAVGGRLVIPVGSDVRSQQLLRVRRTSQTDFTQEALAAVRFVPLIGQAGWHNLGMDAKQERSRPAKPFSAVILEHADIISSIAETDLKPLMERIGDARVVLLGESSHGTAEFYDMRARISRELIEHKGFNIVAIEADWPDASHITGYVNGRTAEAPADQPFRRFPTWMWANVQFARFVEWLRGHNLETGYGQQAVSLYGLDLYSMYTSINEVLRFLDNTDPQAAAVARRRYGCLSPWQKDPAAYGAAALSGQYRQCEQEVVGILQQMLESRTQYGPADSHAFLDAVQNARLVANAERYYRTMYYGSRESWNLRDRHMFETLKLMLDFHDADAKAIVWEHNSHIGDAAATEMGAAGEFNVGALCREHFGRQAYLIGFGTDHGTVAAASEWGRPMEIKEVRPAHPDSYEYIFHHSGVNGFILPLSHPARLEVRHTFLDERLERAIGVIYAPETELQSHYFHAALPNQFDEFIWFDETHAIQPLGNLREHGFPKTFPFGV